MTAAPRYDRIGHTYSRFRHTEPTWLDEIDDALGDATRVLNVGAGTGNYESMAGRSITALEPSGVMLKQRPSDAAPAVQAVAEAMPFPDDSFDAVMGVLTVHHWTDRAAGLREVARVADRLVLTVYDTSVTMDFWLLDYFPETRTMPMEVNAPNTATVDRFMRVLEERILWVPRDCKEGYSAASWARPHDYLDPERQTAISLLALSSPEVRARGTAQLAADLESGEWHRKYAHLADLDRADFGYRLVTAERR